MSTGRPAPKPREIEVALPRELGFLLEMHRYKVAYGGRFGAKTRSFAIALLTLGSAQRLRILCCREIMNSIRDSVHQELKIVIEAMGLTSFYTVLDNEIRGRNGTVFIFSGLAGHTIDSLKSYSGIDVAWVEEAQNVRKKSWDILIPTIRAPNSEIWVSFNPDMDTDDTWTRFIEQKPPGSMVVKVGWETAKRAGWWTDTMEAERLHCLKTDPEGYPNIWEGMPKTVVAGAIYAREVMQMVEEGRIRAIPYDPRLPVHTVWDLGWNDAMTIIMVQKPTHNSLNVINYLEDSFLTYAQYVADLNALKYVWGTDWLPHDAESKDPKSGTNAKLLLRGLGRKVKVIPRGDVEEGIKAARMMFPRVYIDDTTRNRATGYLGAKRLLESLKRYRRNVPTTTGEPSTPVHDEFCFGPDTKIRTLGGWKRIADLVGKEFHVWGYSHQERRIVPAKAVRCWEAKTVDVVAKVTLDSGAVITCTPDHRFLLRDGATYVEAQHLTAKSSLMPLYERRVGKQPQLHLNDGTIAVEHRYAYARLIGPLIEGHHVHHLDEDKCNNEPHNLQQMTSAEHCAIHSNTPKHLEHLRRISNRKGSPKATAMLVAMNKARGGDNHHTRSPEYWTEKRRRDVGEQFSQSLKASEREKDCVGCGGVFHANFKRQYCCANCKATALRRRRGAPERPWKVSNPHRADCQLHAPHNHRVVSVEIVRERTAVYDIEVADIHNFVAEGVVVHNCHGADAWRYLATIVDQIRNDIDGPPPAQIEPFRNPIGSMGLLG